MTNGWRPLLTGLEAERARTVALEVASRLVDQERVDRALARAGAVLRQAGSPSRSWSLPGLSGASCSVALVCAQLDRLHPGDGWDRLGHARLTAAAEAAERDGAPLGLYEGVAGVGYSAERLADGRARYGKLLRSVDEPLAGVVGARRASLAQARGPVSDWDLISGITGLGVYLLTRRAVPAARAALYQVLAALVDRSGRADAETRWATPAKFLFEDMRESAPEGNVNCGLAHGVPGPLALMSLGLLNGVEVDGQIEAVRRMAAWLAGRAQPGRWGPDWPAAVPLGIRDVPPPPSRPGWCYGNAGVARALWLTGRALDEPEHSRLAVEALRQALERQAAERPLDSPTFCHGLAGLAQVTLRIAADSGDELLCRHARGLSLELVEHFDPDAALGYRDVTVARDGLTLAVDNPTLLSGAAGTALVLLAASTGRDPGWDRAMLLS